MPGIIPLENVVQDFFGNEWDKDPLSYEGINEFLRKSFPNRSVNQWSVFVWNVNTFFLSLCNAFHERDATSFSAEKPSEESEEISRKERKRAKKERKRAWKRAIKASRDHQLIVLKMLNKASEKDRKKLFRVFRHFIAHVSESETETEVEAEAETEAEAEALRCLLVEVYFSFCLAYRAGLYKAFYEYTKKS